MRETGWLVLLVALLLGCTSPSNPTSTPSEESTSSTTPVATTSTTTAPGTTAAHVGGETLRVGTTAHFSNLDPADAFSFADWEILQATGEGPLRLEPGTGDLLLGIAESEPEVSEDGLTYTFEIRPDVVFADGTDLTAQSYVESIERVMNVGGRAADLVSPYLASVEAPDGDTVAFHLRDRYAFFPTILAGAAYLPTNPETYPPDQLAPMPTTPIYGVGPWYVESYSDTEIRLAPNPFYFGEAPNIGPIEIEIFASATEMADALSAGDVDVIWRGVDNDAAASLASADDVVVETVPAGTLHFLAVNHALSSTDDPEVRHAIANVIDRQSIVDSVLGGAFVPAFSPVPQGYVGSSDTFLDVYGQPDVGRAIDRLTAAGYTEAEPAQIELAYPPERFGLDITAAMEEIELQLEATGLVDVTLTAQPWETYVGDVVDGTYNLAFLGWLQDFPDTHNYLAPFVLDGGLGGSGEGLESPQLSDLVMEAAIQMDGERRAALYEQVQTLFADQVITIPLWVEHPYIAYRDRVDGNTGLDHAEALNIGNSLELDFRSIEIDAG